MSKTVLSGIQSSGQFTLGNYLGAMRHWAVDQDQTKNYFFIANLHAITVRQDPAQLRANTYAAAAWLLAAGVDPAKSTIFVQSQVPAHSELGWILNNYVTVGELNRMTQYKDKSQRLGAEGQLAGLYDYPVLMAADILLYGADEVPVGEDQKQHIELTRDVATRFNNLYGDTFVVPTPAIHKASARIMNLQDPNRKMSKSDSDLSGVILLEDDADTLRSKVMKAVTDSGSTIEATDDKPALTNLLTIFSLMSGESVGSLEQKYAGQGYGAFKTDLAEVLVSAIVPLQVKQQEILNGDSLSTILSEGALQAQTIANAKLAEVKEKLGLL